MAILIFLLVVVGIGYRATSSDERARFLRIALGFARELKEASSYGRAACEPFREALRARTPLALVTMALAALNVAIFIRMIFGAGALSDPATLVGWGGSFGPRTTNGEWWRLVTSMFVHAGFFQLLFTLVALVPLGLILERQVGHFAFAVVYLVAGALAGLMSLSGQPVAVTIGPAGAIYGLYGLLAASLIAGVFNPTPVTIPLIALLRLAPAAALFLLYSLAGGGLEGSAELVGFLAGLAGGIALSVGVGEGKPPLKRVAATMAAAVVVTSAAAFPLRGIADVRPEIARVVAMEDRTAGAYQSAVNRSRNHQLNVDALVQLITRTIMPELESARSHLKAITGVPHEHAPLVAAADEYLRLRDESWRLRADGLRKANMVTLSKAEKTERASLEALQKIKSDDSK